MSKSGARPKPRLVASFGSEVWVFDLLNLKTGGLNCEPQSGSPMSQFERPAMKGLL